MLHLFVPLLWAAPRIPDFAGEAARVGGPPTVTLGPGFVRGDMVGPTQAEIGFSPGMVAVFEAGGGWARGFVGLQSAPMFIWLAGDEGGGIDLAMVDLGWTTGTDRLRAGPFMTVGLFGVGSGVRVVFTPWDTANGLPRGIEARLTWYAPRAGHAGVYFVRSIPTGNTRRSEPSTAAFCSRFLTGVGWATSASSTQRSWDLIGQDDGLEFANSPMLAMTCETDGDHGGWHIGGETAPWLTYRAPTWDGGADRKVQHFGSLTVGAYLGGDVLRLGPFASVGVWTVAAGARLSVTPFENRHGRRHGLELRAVGTLPSAPAVEAMALYSIAFDPRP